MDRERTDEWFGHPGLDGSEHPLRSPESAPGKVAARGPAGPPEEPLPVPPLRGLPHCPKCLYYHHEWEECPHA